MLVLSRKVNESVIITTPEGQTIKVSVGNCEKLKPKGVNENELRTHDRR